MKKKNKWRREIGPEEDVKKTFNATYIYFQKDKHVLQVLPATATR